MKFYNKQNKFSYQPTNYYKPVLISENDQLTKY